MATDSNPIKEAAHAYADRGFHIIPLHRVGPDGLTCSCKDGRGCKSAGKHPITNAWQKEAQLSGADIETWFGERPKNLGIVTGPESGVFVADLDGEEGSASMAALIAEHGELPPTLTAKTGSGGWHFFFEYPDFEIGNTASTKLGKGVDTRGKGGYVVAAPSISAKGPYKIVRDLPVAKAPEWLLERLRPKERKHTTTAPTVELPPAERARIDGYVEGAVRHELDRLRALHWDGDPSQYRGEPWDHTTFEVAANLIQLTNAPWASLDRGPLYDSFVEAAPKDPGFDLARIDAKWESALKKVDGNEAAYPPKPADAFWLTGPEPSTPTRTEQAAEVNTPADPFDTAVANMASDAPPAAPPSIEIVEFNGIPTSDAHTLDPGYVAHAKAAALGPQYRAGAYVEEVRSEASSWDIEEFIAQPKAGPGPTDLAPVNDWMRRSLRSGTPELLWAALRSIILGVDTDAPAIVLKGGGPILALLARTLAPAIGAQAETMLLGPRVTTREVDGPQIVFEFDDDEQIDLQPYAYAIIMRAREAPGELRIPDEETHDELEKLTDYRAAQLHRSRLGLGSRPRVNGESDAT